MSTRKKILIDAHCFDGERTEGIHSHLSGLYRELIKMAPDFEFIFASAEPRKLTAIFGEGENVKYVKLNSRSRSHRLLNELPAIIKKEKVDVAHFQYTAPPVKNCFTIVTLHDILFKDFPEFFPACYRIKRDIPFRISAVRADMLCTVSEYSRHRISRHYKIDKDKITVVPNAVSASFKRPPEQDLQEFKKIRKIDKYLLYVSRFEPRKNHEAVLRHYLNMKLWEQGYDLVFIGIRSIKVPRLEKILSKLTDKILRHIRIFDYIQEEELLYWYANASLFVYPSLAEGFGIPPIEAATMGIPVVCNNNTAMHDFQFFGDNLVDFRHPGRVRAIISKTLNGYPVQEIERIRSSIAERFNWHKNAEIFLDTLKRKLDEKGDKK